MQDVQDVQDLQKAPVTRVRRYSRLRAAVALAAGLLLTGSAPLAELSRPAAQSAQAPTAAPAPAAQPLAPEPADQPDFAAFLVAVRAEALARGISEKTVQRALGNLEPSTAVIQRDQTQAEVVLSIEQYLQRRVTRGVVRTARQMASRHRSVLARVAKAYGVPSRVLVAVWGMESNFGRFSGVRPTIQALATLAWEGRRGEFFRGELLDALQIIDRGDIGVDRMRGSWAGAMGQPQFMPSSYLQWAQDFDGDGRRDIWASTGDVFASIANYLKGHGWVEGFTWGREVRLRGGDLDALRTEAGMRIEGCRAVRAMTTALPLERWQGLGVRTTGGAALPRVEIDGSLLHTGERAFLVYGNYEALLAYNCSHSYALAVSLLSDQIGA